MKVHDDFGRDSENCDAQGLQRSKSGINLCGCVVNVKAVEDFHAQISSIASTLLDEFRLTFQL